MKYKIYTIPLIQQKIVFIICSNGKEFKTILKKKDVLKLLSWFGTDETFFKDNNNFGTTYTVGDSSCPMYPVIIRISSKLKGKDLEETLSHEIAHLVYLMQKFLGIIEENEFNAYLSGVINADFREFLNTK